MENVSSRPCLGRFFVLFAVSVALTLVFVAAAVAQDDATDPLAGETAEFVDTDDDTIADQITIPVANCQAATDATLIAKDPAGEELTIDSNDATFTGDETQLTIDATTTNLIGDPDPGTGEIVSSTGFTCTDTADADRQNQDAAQSDGSCSNPREVASVGPTADNTKTPFETTGPTFRVSYDVTFTTDDDFRVAEIDIEDRFGLVDFVNLDEDANDSFVVTEGAGSYDLVVNIDPPNGADYTVTVEDCGGGSPGGQTGDDQTGDDGQGNADKQYEVIKVTIVKGLPKTGGPSPLLLPCLVALVAAGIVVLRRS